MKISINWLKDFVDLNGITDEEIIKRFFTLENLPTIIVYTLYLLAAIVLITCILKTVKKKRQNRR